MLKSNLIYNRPTESEPSYYITDKNGDSNVDANNTDNPEYMSDNDSDEQKFFHAIVTPNSKLDKRPENLDKALLQSQCIVSLKAEFLTLRKISLWEKLIRS